MLRGGQGVISVTANVAPARMRDYAISHLVDDVSAWIGSAGQATLILVAIATLLGYQGDSLMGAVMLGLGEVTVTENESA